MFLFKYFTAVLASTFMAVVDASCARKDNSPANADPRGEDKAKSSWSNGDWAWWRCRPGFVRPDPDQPTTYTKKDLKMTCLNTAKYGWWDQWVYGDEKGESNAERCVSVRLIESTI